MPVVVAASPQVIEQVWVSLVPASVKGAETDTATPAPTDAPPSGAVMETLGFAFETVNVVVSKTGAFTPSETVNLSV